jgi:hypothetical protein
MMRVVRKSVLYRGMFTMRSVHARAKGGKSVYRRILAVRRISVDLNASSRRPACMRARRTARPFTDEFTPFAEFPLT